MAAERFRTLDALRGIAALWIILFHVLDSHPGYGKFIYRIIRQGDLGVPIFLVISGFGMAAAAEQALATHEHPLTFFSYSLYLLHVPLEEPVTLVVRRLAPVSFYLTDPLIVIPVIVGLSYVWHLVVEKPGSAGLQR